MIINLSPYSLNDNLSNFKKEVLLIGITYYERHLIFEHLKPAITHLFNFPVKTIELGFESEKLISIRIILYGCSVEELACTLEDNLKINNIRVADVENFYSDTQLHSSWKDNEHILELGTRRNKTYEVFVFFLLNNHT